MDMPEVSKCDVTQCAYNHGQICHALAITIGDESHPRCDTFTIGTEKGGDSQAVGKVGACKVEECVYNASLECQAPDIHVGYREDEADCLTFKSRQQAYI